MLLLSCSSGTNPPSGAKEEDTRVLYVGSFYQYARGDQDISFKVQLLKFEGVIVMCI